MHLLEDSVDAPSLDKYTGVYHSDANIHGEQARLQHCQIIHQLILLLIFFWAYFRFRFAFPEMPSIYCCSTFTAQENMPL